MSKKIISQLALSNSAEELLQAIVKEEITEEEFCNYILPNYSMVSVIGWLNTKVSFLGDRWVLMDDYIQVVCSGWFFKYVKNNRILYDDAIYLQYIPEDSANSLLYNIANYMQSKGEYDFRFKDILKVEDLLGIGDVLREIYPEDGKFQLIENEVKRLSWHIMNEDGKHEELLQAYVKIKEEVAKGCNNL